MRTAVSELEAFYASPLGGLVAEIVAEKLVQAWGRADNLRVAGFGFAQPFMSAFDKAQCAVALLPEGMGVRAGQSIPGVLVNDHLWPLPDSSVERLLVIHGIEEGGSPRRMLREAWRVLSDDGVMIVVTANRRGPWSIVETSPFAAGRPYSRRQLDQLLKGAMFAPTAYATALHFPPLTAKSMHGIARGWERIGAGLEGLNLPWLFPNVAGLNLVEVRKSTAVPISGSKAEIFRPGYLLPTGMGAPQGSRRTPKSSQSHRPRIAAAPNAGHCPK